MARRVQVKGVLRRDDLIPRSDFLKGGIDPRDEDPALIGLHKLASNGVPSAEPFLALTFVKVQMINIPQSERVQYVINSVDNGKAYFYGQDHQIYSITAFIIDSDLTISQRRAMEGVAGNTLSVWNTLYEKYFRASECARQRNIVSIKWRAARYWGYLVASSVSGSAAVHNSYTIGINFFSVRQDIEVSPPMINDRSISEKKFTGILTREGVDALVAVKMPALTGLIPRSRLKAKTEGRSRVPG